MAATHGYQAEANQQYNCINRLVIPGENRSLSQLHECDAQTQK